MLKPTYYVTALMLLALGSVAPVAAQSSVRVGYMPIAEELPKMVANEKGFFKKRGLNAELVRFESGPDMGTALLGGSIQIGMIGTPGLINAAVAGRPLVAIVDNGSNVGGSKGYEYYTGLVVLDNSPNQGHWRPEREENRRQRSEGQFRGSDRDATAPMEQGASRPQTRSHQGHPVYHASIRIHAGRAGAEPRRRG